jgi:hypothetical protein
MRRGRGRKPKGPKKVSYRLIDHNSAEGKPVYAMLGEIVEAHHEDIRHARIALAWNLTWKPDVDGRVILGKCKKASDLDRELAEFDFVVILQQRFWEDASVDDKRRRALLDHELCHASIKLDPITGEPVEDERGRKVYRIRKHDIEEFASIVERHGMWKRELEAFAASLRRSKQGTLPLEPDGAGPNAPQTTQVLAKVAELAGEVKPSEPHAFLAVGGAGMAGQVCKHWGAGMAGQVCKHCGSGKDDPVHVPRDVTETSKPGEVPAQASVAAARERVNGNGKGKGKGAVHARTRSTTAERRHGKAARP